MGGEFAAAVNSIRFVSGPPPHGRGIGTCGRRELRPRRSTPAWAGNSPSTAEQVESRSVHPRMGGEFKRQSHSDSGWTGPPPHGRGIRIRGEDRVGASRSTPARVGNSGTAPRRSEGWSVHPRMGGEFHERFGWRRNAVGPPPHGRGIRRRVDPRTHPLRSTPAWAGNSSGVVQAAMTVTVHPRMGGEFGAVWEPDYCPIGPPPHGRGIRLVGEVEQPRERSTPAWAGNSGTPGGPSRRRPVHPRMGGEFLVRVGNVWVKGGPPPHGRGIQADGVVDAPLQRSTPAWAGNSGGWRR